MLLRLLLDLDPHTQVHHCKDKDKHRHRHKNSFNRTLVLERVDRGAPVHNRDLLAQRLLARVAL